MKHALWICVLALGVAGAQDRGVYLRGEIDGEPTFGVLTSSDSGRTVRIELVSGESGQGSRVDSRTFHIPLRPGAEGGVEGDGMAGRLRGAERQTQAEDDPNMGLVVRVVRLRGGRIQYRVFRDRERAGELLPCARFVIDPSLDTPSAPGTDGELTRFRDFDSALGAPPCGCDDEGEPEDLVRDAWYARHAVAGWGVLRAMWDFYKPGSRRLEELRGDMTRADTTALRERLDDRLEAPWTAEQIFREARDVTGDDREALELCFAFFVDERSVPARQFMGIAPDVPIHDKYEHFFASAIMAHRSNATGSFTVGWLKEVLDEVAGTGYNEDDLTADALGADFGQALHQGVIRPY